MRNPHKTHCHLLIIPVLLTLLAAGPILAQDKKTANRIAVLNFSANNTDEGIARIVRNVAEVNFFKDGSFDILEQTQMDIILKERKQQLTECRDERCAASLGKLLNANYVIIGSVDRLDTFTVTIKVVDVKTGRIIINESREAKEVADLKPASVELTRKVVDRIKGADRGTAAGSKFPIVITANFMYAAPLAYFSTISRGGYGATLTACIENIGVSGLFAGIDLQFIYLGGRDRVQYAMMVPLMGRFGYAVKFWRMSFSPALSAGISYNMNYYYADFLRINKGRRAGAVFILKPGVEFEILIIKNFYARIGADYGIMFEKGGSLQMITCTAGLGVRF